MKLTLKDMIVVAAGTLVMLLLTGIMGLSGGSLVVLGMLEAALLLGLVIWKQHQTEASLEQLESYLKSLVSNHTPIALSLPAPWQTTTKLLKSIQTYLKISRQSLEDRSLLYTEMEQKLEEREQKLEINEKKLLESEDKLRQNEQKLQRSEYKVLEYTLALQHINLIQRKLQGQLNIGSLLTEATQLLVFHLCAHRGIFFRMDYQNQAVQVMSPINCPFDETASLPLEPLQQLLHQYGLDNPPPTESQEGNIRILRLSEDISPLYEIPFSSALLVPVWVDRDLWGLFCLVDKEERMNLINGQQSFTSFGESDELILRNVVAFLQKDLRNAYLFEMATVDSLSQLYVRRYFENRLRDEIRRTRRHPAVFSVLMLDIDHFKQVNDTYGHLVGDVVIRKVADILRNSLRQGIDLPARYGGEEMIVLLPNTHIEGATLVAERIRRSVSELVIDEIAHSKDLPHITISIGVSSFPSQSTEFKPLLEAADQALYRAKAGGRNRVCSANEILK